MYAPQVPGGLMHSIVLPESLAGHPWAQDKPPLDAGTAWRESVQEAFLSFGASSYARARFTSSQGTEWRRATYSIHPQADYPILVIHDRFSGQDAEASKIFSLNLMAQGDVDTPAGRRVPPLRAHEPNNERPSAGKVFPLQPGLNRLGFTGQWLIDWDLYTLASQPQEAQIGNWAHSWHPNREQSEFAKANGRVFEERQHILRLKGRGAFKVFILPFRKGERRADLQMQQAGSKITITTRDGTTIVDDAYYAYQNSHKRILTTFSAQRTEANGISAAGGPVEIIVEQQQAIITAHGQKGMRQMTLPGTWRIKDPQGPKALLAFRAGSWILDYQEEAPLTVNLER